MGRKNTPLEGPKRPRQPREQKPPTQVVKGPRIDLSSIEDVQRKQTESDLAKRIVKAFQFTLLGLFLLSLICVGITAWSPERGKAVLETLLTFFKVAGEFLLAVFNPLLAFILGYYFARHSRR